MLRRHWTLWTDEELCELIDLWPTHSVAQIAKRLHRSPSSTGQRARQLLKDGVLEGTMASHSMLVGTRSITTAIRPDLQDFEEVKRDYCRQHHITIAELCSRFERDEQFAAELYRLAQAAKLTRMAVGGVAETKRLAKVEPDAGSIDHQPAPSSAPACHRTSRSGKAEQQPSPHSAAQSESIR